MSNKVNWTDAQKNAIDSKNSSILVSAAAGSGKTAVLVERILRKLETTDIDRFIIVTFTEAAASQMKKGIADKIKERIRDDSFPEELKNRLKKQLLLINDASISTMHSFCSKLIRSHFQELDISADFSIMQPEERKLIFKEAYDEVTMQLYEEKDENFLSLVTAYSKNADDDVVFNMTEIIYNASQSMPYPEKWLDDSVENFDTASITNTIWFKEIVEAIEEKIRVNKEIYESQSKFLDENPQLELRDLFETDLLEAQQLLDTLNAPVTDYGAFQSSFKLQRRDFPRKYSKDANAQAFKVHRDEFRANIKKVIDEFLYCSEDVLLKLLDICALQGKTLRSLTEKIAVVFGEKKAEKNALDYNDLEHLTIKLLCDHKGNPSETAKELQNEYDEIIIDEYQDTNPVQEVIFTAISKDRKNLFMVGDMKQCIYKFRNAEPSIFIEKIDSFSEEGNEYGKKIFLSSNFRSRKSILDFTNLVFSQIMDRKAGEIDYTENEMLNYGSASYNDDDPETEILLIPDESAEEDDMENTEREAYIAGAKIQQMIDSGFRVTDKNGEQRSASYRDFSILLRAAKGVIGVFASTLTNMGIPVFVDDNTEYLLSSYEIKVILAFLKIIDNPYDDISAASVLKSPIFGLSDDSLALASTENKESFCEKVFAYDFNDSHERIIAENFKSTLEKYRNLKTHLNSYEMIKQILADSNFYEYAGAMSGGLQRQSNINYLLKCAKDFEADSFKGIYAFLNYIDNYDDKIASMISPKKLPDNADSVTITTIHKSKGLEYPVVILPKASTKFNLSSKSKIETHNRFGFALDCVSDRHIKYKSPVKNALMNVKKNEGISEEMRILYVALTRAKEKLVVMGTINGEKLAKKMTASAKSKNLKLGSHIVREGSSIMEWLCMSLVRFSCFEEIRNTLKIDSEIFKTHCPVSVKFVSLKDFEYCQNTSKALDLENSHEYDKQNTDEIFTWQYNHISNEVYTKYSVSNIKHNASHYGNIHSLKERLSDVNDERSLLGGAEKGTLIHLVLERAVKMCIKDEEALNNMINELLNNNVINQKEFESIPVKQIMNFINSDICKDVYASKEVYTESPFEIMCDSSIADKETQGVEILVQGVIDLYYCSGNNYTVIDFKSDRITDENLAYKVKDYEVQLSLYKAAVRKMHNTQNVKAYLYFLEADKLIEI